MQAIAGLFPDVSGWGFLEYFFVGLLVSQVVVVSAFALFLVVQQFRNPARRDPRP